jgi:hypothetical protein
MIDPHDYELTDEEHEALVLISEHAIESPYYTEEELNQMCDYQEALNKLEQLEDELMLCDFTDPKRFEIDREITQLEAWIEDLLVTAKKG